MNSKKIYPSVSQKRRLYLMLEADEELRAGKFSCSFTRKEAERRWIEIAEVVNGIGGAVKNWKEWKKTWQDMKTKTKKRQSAINRAASATGGGPPPPPLTEESIVLRTISKNMISGHNDSQESVVEFIDLKVPLTQGHTFEGFTASIASDASEPTVSQALQDLILLPPEQFRDNTIPTIHFWSGQEPNSQIQETPAALRKGSLVKKSALVESYINISQCLSYLHCIYNKYVGSFVPYSYIFM